MKLVFIILGILFCNKADGLLDLEKSLVLNFHHKMKKEVGLADHLPGPASNMRVLKWNEELAAKAQEYANLCLSTKQASNDRFTASIDLFGQNIGNGYDILQALNSWKDQEMSYNYYSPGSNYLTWADFSQAIWADSDKIGCAATECAGTVKPLHLVCNYARMGNYYGEKAYLVGQNTCDDCPISHSHCVMGFCAKTANETVSFDIDVLYEQDDDEELPEGVIPAPGESAKCRPMEQKKGSCVFPFWYNGDRFDDCDSWCSEDTEYNSKWHYCDSRQSDEQCVIPFEYKGVSYDSCQLGRYGRYWCSEDAVYSDKWHYCY